MQCDINFEKCRLNFESKNAKILHKCDAILKIGYQKI